MVFEFCTILKAILFVIKKYVIFFLHLNLFNLLYLT